MSRHVRGIRRGHGRHVSGQAARGARLQSRAQSIRPAPAPSRPPLTLHASSMHAPSPRDREIQSLEMLRGMLQSASHSTDRGENARNAHSRLPDGLRSTAITNTATTSDNQHEFAQFHSRKSVSLGFSLHIQSCLFDKAARANAQTLHNACPTGGFSMRECAPVRYGASGLHQGQLGLVIRRAVHEIFRRWVSFFQD